MLLCRQHFLPLALDPSLPRRIPNVDYKSSRAGRYLGDREAHKRCDRGRRMEHADPPRRQPSDRRPGWRGRHGSARASAAKMSLVLLSAVAAAGLQPGGPGCDVTVAFGSFAMGIDRRAAARVDRVIRSSQIRVTRSAYGREGEYSLCIRVRSTEQAVSLFEKLRESLRVPVRAPVSLRGPHESYSAPVPAPVVERLNKR